MGAEPRAIIDDIVSGMNSENCTRHVEVDRYAAIELAIFLAQRGDTVLIAVKGHETIQEVSGTHFHFDDREAVRDILPVPNLHAPAPYERLSA